MKYFGIVFSALLLVACGGGGSSTAVAPITPTNVAPVASAGAAQSVIAGTLVSLDGGASSDANSDPLTYTWTLTSKPVGSAATLTAATLSKPSFTADVAGTYIASLTVNDGKVNSGAATVGITVTAYAYPTVTVAKRTGFVKGVFTMDVGGFMQDTYAQGLFEPTYDRIAKQIGANLVANSDPVFLHAFDTTLGTVSMGKMESPTSYGMLTRDQYVKIVSAAHSRNMQFMLLLGITPDGRTMDKWSSEIGNVPASNVAFWDAWFAAYTPIVLEYAGIARDLKIEYLSLGMNSGYMSQLPVKYWSDLVSAVRSTGYTGKLVYQAMTNPENSYGEFNVFNGSCCYLSAPDQLSKRLEFVKLFDTIVLDVGNIARNRTTPRTISRDEIKQSFRWLLGEVSNYPVPVMVQIATPSVLGGAVVPEYIEPCTACGSVAPSRQRDDMQQADVYQALAEVVNESPVGAGNVMGIISWGYWFTDDYYKWQPTVGQPFEMAYDKSANVRGKYAETVLKWWFDRW